ncbi:ester cyclase [Mycobacterium sp. URHD0025]|uniref:ester cyclase n=1 Tax=Mycobacterium sp. URHD0025 TaxID=1298864 RepID=UPI000406C73E|nr:ester cyclase [Mycobacterium sp. URHD0025]
MNRRDEYLNLYLSYLEYCNKHDFAAMATFYTPTIKIDGVAMDPGAVTAQFTPLITAFPDWHWEMQHILVDGDDIVVRFTVTGTHRGIFRGIEATGRRVTVSEFTLYHLQDGKFAEVWDLLDTDGIVAQIREAEPLD